MLLFFTTKIGFSFGLSKLKNEISLKKNKPTKPKVRLTCSQYPKKQKPITV